MNFSKKIICDNIHGPIGISELEQKIINTRTFQRLKKIKQLGLVSLVFPGAEHSRFSHSIGVMHIMSRMVDQLRKEKCDYVMRDKQKQELRLAALLHDIGHYPMSHMGEKTFEWIDQEPRSKIVLADEDDDNQLENLLLRAGMNWKSDVVKHEKLGKLILTSKTSEIRKLLKKHRYDPYEISKIIASESPKNPFYSQLMNSTLDCDRLDYLLRDSRMAGVSYGLVDLEYVLQNLRWHKNEKRVCFHEKAIHALEHFITARFYHYNIVYHKAVMGFELMAKALFYAMIKCPNFDPPIPYNIVESFEDITEKVKTDKSFLANFTDEYFWFYLDRWIPPDDLCSRLRERLFSRTPLGLIAEERILFSSAEDTNVIKYNYFRNSIWDSIEFRNTLSEKNMDIESLSVTERKITFEAVPSAMEYLQGKEIAKEDILKLVKILRENELEDLIKNKSSIIHLLSQYETRLIRMYGLVDEEQRKSLKGTVVGLVNRL